ncbi:MAG: hypothetical protein HYZ26_11745 [Chloroflexi bacterium]|nr:hypothetical protein [Chloroflexota bacterium]
MRPGDFTGSLQVRKKEAQVSIYVSSIGRFAQPDTVLPSLRSPQSLNRFSYAYNNPIMFIDSSGHAGCPADDVDIWLGNAPDCDGIEIAKEHVVNKNGTALVAAGIAVQSQWLQSEETERKHHEINPNSSSGYGIAQASYSETDDPFDPQNAIEVMETRIENALQPCTGGVIVCTATDMIIIAALAQNNILDASAVTGLANNEEREPRWIAYFRGQSEPNPLSGLSAWLRETQTGQRFQGSFMLRLFLNDLYELLDAGYTLPAGFDVVDWEYLEYLANLTTDELDELGQ